MGGAQMSSLRLSAGVLGIVRYHGLFLLVSLLTTIRLDQPTASGRDDQTVPPATRSPEQSAPGFVVLSGWTRFASGSGRNVRARGSAFAGHPCVCSFDGRGVPVGCPGDPTESRCNP